MATQQIGFYGDLRNCSGCKACAIACRDKNNTDLGVRWRRVYEVGGGDWQQNGEVLVDNTFSYFVSSACSHCANPACVPVCPTAAITKREEDGVVLIDRSKCVGCRYCEWACPYGAPQFDAATGTMSKCDFCADYLAEGKDPACVASCQMRVLKYGNIDELRAQYGSAGDIFPFPESALTGPNTTFSPHKDAVPSSDAGAQILNPEEV
jgi:anaerobic dimethyl sulfoxide reductase subunit B